MSITKEVCVGCDHPISSHFNDVTGVARCLVVDSGVSSRGIVGIPWEHPCDCTNFVSENAAHRRSRKQADQKRKDDVVDYMVKKIRGDTP